MAEEDNVQSFGVDQPTDTPSESPSSTLAKADNVDKEPPIKKLKVKVIHVNTNSKHEAEVKEGDDHDSGSDSGSYSDSEDEAIKPQKPKCIMCGKLTDVLCARCKSANYCGVDCQKKDWRLHKILCQQYANFIQDNPRPSPKHYAVFLFPHNFNIPSIQWARSSRSTLGDIEMFLAYPGEDPKSISLETHSAFERRGEPNWSLGYTLTMYFRSVFYGHAINLSIEKLGRGKLEQEWRGPVVVANDHGDVTMADLRYIIQHLQIPPGLLEASLET